MLLSFLFKDGHCAVSLAINMEHTDTAVFLIKQGARMDLKDKVFKFYIKKDIHTILRRLDAGCEV